MNSGIDVHRLHLRLRRLLPPSAGSTARGARSSRGLSLGVIESLVVGNYSEDWFGTDLRSTSEIRTVVAFVVILVVLLVQVRAGLFGSTRVERV